IVGNATEFKLDTTENNIPKKALIIKHDAKLFKSPYHLPRTAKKASFLQLYFLMKPEKYNRVPVLKKFSKTKTNPDMRLEKGAYVEWNTIQMINFTPQKGRKRVNIYASKKCAKTYARYGKTTEACQALGEEGPLFDNKQQYKLLIPVFQRDKDNYHGGFLRLYQEKSSEKQQGPLGYDLILVVDSSMSMGKYFRPTMEVLQTFVKLIRESTQTEVVIPLRIGLLFYRDRKGKNCDLDYVTQWAQHLTSDVQKVIQALNQTKATECSSLNNQEAVWDGINRAIVDTVWHKNNLQTIILIGDAPPYSEKDTENNPMQFSVAYLHDKAKKGKNIRFLT
ncbi:vWA domain-containing protein, partial [Candidatus Marithioploca araucensis]|nr:vWA domain-containing protein [Candidatus Marithioploca araucensis]